jgi:dihydroneopterin aldolase
VEKLAEEISHLIREEFNVPWVKLILNKKGAISGASDVGCVMRTFLYCVCARDPLLSV